MKLVQDAIAPTGIDCYAGAWRATEAQPSPPETYLVYTVSRHEARHSDDETTDWSIYVYMEMFSAADPTAARRAVRQAMYAAGWALVEERETYEQDTETNRVSWTWVIWLDPDEESAS